MIQIAFSLIAITCDSITVPHYRILISFDTIFVAHNCIAITIDTIRVPNQLIFLSFNRIATTLKPIPTPINFVGRPNDKTIPAIQSITISQQFVQVTSDNILIPIVGIAASCDDWSLPDDEVGWTIDGIVAALDLVFLASYHDVLAFCYILSTSYGCFVDDQGVLRTWN